MKRIVLYLRVSTDRQETLRQKQELTEYAKRLGYEVVEILEEKESGFSDGRSEFNRLLAYTKNDIDAVMVWEVSRIGRKTSQIIQTIENWADEGICFISKKENLVSLDSDGKMNANTKLYLSIMATIAENEAQTIKERMLSGRRYKLLKDETRYSNIIPQGYKLENNQIVIDEEQAEIIRKMFRMRSEGYSLAAIAKTLRLPQKSIYSKLHSETYKGIGRNKLCPDKIFPVPAIVDEELWNKAQSFDVPERKNITNTTVLIPLRQKIVCPICGRHFIYKKSTRVNSKSKHASYECRQTYVPNLGKKHPKYSSTINFNDLNSAVESVINSWRTSTRPIKIEDTSNLEAYVETISTELSSKERTYILSRKKYEAVAAYLSDTEKRKEIAVLNSLADEIEALKMNINQNRKKLDNLIALKSAVYIPSEKEPWYELVKEVRMTKWGPKCRDFEVTTITGEKLQTSVLTRIGGKKPRIVPK